MSARRWRRALAAALRSMNRDKIADMWIEQGIRPPEGPVTFWAAVHKARAACLDLTEDERAKSRQWLAANGFRDSLSGPRVQ